MNYDDFEDGFSYTSVGAIHFKHHRSSGEKIIFIHGLGGTTLAWKRLMGCLPDDLDIYLIDLLGHGESDAPDVDYTVSVQFQALREFISLNNNGDSYLFGHSYGGWVAAYYATQPYTCRGLILEDPAGLKEEHEEALSSGKAIGKMEEAMKIALDEGNKEHVIRSILSTFYSNTEEELTGESLSQIKAKTQIIWGALDSVSPVKYAASLQSKIKGSVLSVVQGADHKPHYDQPKEVSDIILKFIGHAKS